MTPDPLPARLPTGTLERTLGLAWARHDFLVPTRWPWIHIGHWLGRADLPRLDDKLRLLRQARHAEPSRAAPQPACATCWTNQRSGCLIDLVGTGHTIPRQYLLFNAF